MKKIILIIILTLGIILMIPGVHAFTVNGTYIEPNEAVYLQPGTTSEYSVYNWHFFSTPNDEYYSNLALVVSELTGFDNTTRIYSFRSDVLNYIDINYPSYIRYNLPNLQYLVIEDDTPSPTLSFYNNIGTLITQLSYHEITNALPLTYPVTVGFEVLAYDYQFYNSAYNHGYDTGRFEGYNEGYDYAKAEYGYYDGTNWITASVRAQQRYNDGLSENRSFYGIFYNDEWLTATQFGNIRYNQGFDIGLDTEINWFEWSSTFFLMPFRILNIQILPGLRIGYFALFSLLIGVVGWFFFIVGKGGKRK